MNGGDEQRHWTLNAFDTCAGIPMDIEERIMVMSGCSEHPRSSSLAGLDTMSD